VRNLDTFDQWCLRHILGISWRARISNKKGRRHTDQPPLTHIIHTTRLKFFGHIARVDPSMDHGRALRASVAPLPRDWNCQSGRPRGPRHTWLRTIEPGLTPFNIGLATTYHREQNRVDKHEHARRNGNVHRKTSHMMMMMMMYGTTQEHYLTSYSVLYITPQNRPIGACCRVQSQK